MEESNKKISKETMKDVEERHLPDEIIIQHILPLLPLKPLIRCKLISKQWDRIVNFFLDYIKPTIYSRPFIPIESLFIQSGGRFYIYTCNNHDHDVVDVIYMRTSEYKLVELNAEFDVGIRENIGLVGSCNGLVCLGEIYGKYFILWNPEINQFHKYFLYSKNQFHKYYLEYHLERDSKEICWGFGYVSSLDDYKVVRISQFRFQAKVDSVHVFSLRSNSWSRIEFSVGEFKLVGRSKLVNEILYWRKENDNVNGNVQIVSFDLGLETFAVLPDLAIRAPGNAVLCVMGGCLSVCVLNSDTDLEIHIVKQLGRVVKVCYSDLDKTENSINDLIGLTKVGKIFVVYPGCFVKCLIVTSSNKSIVTFKANGRHRSNYMDSYVSSLVSPHPPVELPNALGQVA